MENKHVGYILLCVSLLIIGIILLFNSTMKDFVEENCTEAHGGNYCPMYKTINDQTLLSLAIVGIIIVFGFALILIKPKEKIVVRKIKEKKQIKEVDLSSFRVEEKQVYNMIQEQGAVFQAELIEKTGFGKAKMSRIIDRLEGNGLVERKRRGMTNVVVLKEN